MKKLIIIAIIIITITFSIAAINTFKSGVDTMTKIKNQRTTVELAIN